MKNVALVIAAGGSSTRMGGGTPKQYRTLQGAPMLARSIEAFCAFPQIRSCAIAADDVAVCRRVLGARGAALALALGGPCGDLPAACGRFSEADGSLRIVRGGADRGASVFAALQALPPETDFVLVHDAARPFVSEAVIARVLEALEGGAHGALPGVTPKSTIRTADRTLVRGELYEVQTPQGFVFADLLAAYRAQGFGEGADRAAKGSPVPATDDAGIFERSGGKVTIVQGEYGNIKVTTVEDLPMETRTGLGYDVHRLVAGRKLMLGTVEVPYALGLLGHSDADVVCHAIADALLGAAALGDIGRHFPDSDPAYAGMSGSELLRRTNALLRDAGWRIVSIDATLVAEKPKIAPYVPEMRAGIAAALGIPAERVSVKGTTQEGLGLTANDAGMAASAVANITDLR